MYRLRLRLSMYAYKKACTCILPNFQSTIIVCALRVTHKYTCINIYIHSHVDKRKLSICPLWHAHTHACTRTYIPCTNQLTRLLEKGVRIREGMVLCIRSCLAIGIHRGTLAYIRWGIRLECARGGGWGGGGWGWGVGRGRGRETNL